ncbi:MAG: hypothetical protein V7782_03640 [Psychromonas sp.]
MINYNEQNMMITPFKSLILHIKTLLPVVLFITCSFSVHASSLQVGSTIEQFKLQDQFKTADSNNLDTTHLLFTRSMKGGTIIEKALNSDASLYENQNLIYITDISGMPSLVYRFVAMPSFKKYPFKLAIDSGGYTTNSLPSIDDQATLMLLNQGKIISINFFDSKETLIEALH